MFSGFYGAAFAGAYRGVKHGIMGEPINTKVRHQIMIRNLVCMIQMSPEDQLRYRAWKEGIVD